MKIDRFAIGLAITLLLIEVGCGQHKPRLYEGKVVDEDGAPLQGVSVALCYIGWHWDWSMPGGFPLTWDHVYCSDTVTTDQLGTYRIIFDGPPSTYIRARHKDWVQTKNFQANEPRKERPVVLVSRKIHQQRRIWQEKERENSFRQRKSDESSIDYYCRVVRKRSGTIELLYHGERVKVVQGLLLETDKAIFAMTGSYNTAQTMAAELIVGDTGLNRLEPLLDRFIVLSDKTMCGKNMYLIRSAHNTGRVLSALSKTESINIEVPSLRAVFTMKIWKPE